jgi:hypothetical protein
MHLLDKISPVLRGSGGRVLLTCWRGEDFEAAVRFREDHNFDLIACNSQAEEGPGAHGIDCLYGDFPGEIEGTHRQFSLVIVPGQAVLAGVSPQSHEAFQRDFRHVRAAGRYLAPGGLLVFQTERSRVLAYTSWLSALVKGYARLAAFSSGDDEVIFFGERRRKTAPLDREARDALLDAIRTAGLPPLPYSPRYLLPKARSRRVFFRSRRFDPDAVDGFIQSVPWGKKQLLRAFKGWQQPVIKPAFRLRARHLAYVVASGVLGTIEVKSPLTSEDCIIRGVMRREEIASRKEGEGEEEMLTSTVKASIIVFNTTRRSLLVVDPNDTGQIKSFLDEWARVLIEQIEDRYPVVYDPFNAPYYETFHPYLVRMIDRPLRDGTVNLTAAEEPALTVPQRHVVATTLRCLLGRRALEGNRGDPQDKGARSFFLQGKPGVGKSIMAARIIEGITLEYAHRKGFKAAQPGWPVSVVITVPGVIHEMVEEIRKASRLLEPRIVTNTADLLAVLAYAKTNPRPVVMVIPRSMLSQSQKLVPAYARARLAIMTRTKNTRSCCAHLAWTSSACLLLMGRWRNTSPPRTCSTTHENSRPGAGNAHRAPSPSTRRCARPPGPASTAAMRWCSITSSAARPAAGRSPRSPPIPTSSARWSSPPSARPASSRLYSSMTRSTRTGRRTQAEGWPRPGLPIFSRRCWVYPGACMGANTRPSSTCSTA